MRYFYRGEFGGELILGVPAANYYVQNGSLKETHGVAGSSPLYPFSPKHIEYMNIPRHFIQSGNIHIGNLPSKEWLPPNYKEYYANNRIVFDKPIMVVCNKYAVEWNKSPINFLSIDLLQYIFDTYQNNYQIIYNRCDFNDEDPSYKSGSVLPFNDYDLISQYPDVMAIQNLPPDIIEPVGKPYYNLLQMLLYANCDTFISVQGGNCILASYFKGRNFIFVQRGQELVCDSFRLWYNQLSGCQIYTVDYNAGNVEIPYDTSSEFKNLLKTNLK